jgi:CPA1 family monovalent cation:H+ antiporter
MSLLQITSLLIVLAGVFGTVNYFVFRLPSAIGILVVALLASLGVMLTDLVWPGMAIAATARGLVGSIAFSEALLEGMLGLLLFAGALHVRLSDLKAQWRVVLLMATMGVALSTVLVGTAFSWLTGMPLLAGLVFGALISPTDPVAVLGVLREARLPRSLETKIAGESLFNDGVGYVVFLVLAGLAFPAASDHAQGLQGAARLFAQEAFGGAALGLALGWLVFRVMRHIDDYPLEVLLTLGLAFGGYELAVDAFWKLVDEILNAVLFLMIGVEVFAVAFGPDHLVTGVLAIGLALAGRLAAVAVPVLILGPVRSFSAGVIPIMTWGGLKGGISVALALSLPDSDWKPLILAATYVVVIFSIVVQGLTVGRLAARMGPPAADAGR